MGKREAAARSQKARSGAGEMLHSYWLRRPRGLAADLREARRRTARAWRLLGKERNPQQAQLVYEEEMVEEGGVFGDLWGGNLKLDEEVQAEVQVLGAQQP